MRDVPCDVLGSQILDRAAAKDGKRKLLGGVTGAFGAGMMYVVYVMDRAAVLNHSTTWYFRTAPVLKRNILISGHPATGAIGGSYRTRLLYNTVLCTL